MHVVCPHCRSPIAMTQVEADATIDRLDAASPSDPETVVTNFPEDADMLIGSTLASERVTYDLMTPTTTPVPSRTMTGGFAVDVRQVVDMTTLGVGFGGYSSWLVDDVGFHGVEHIGDERVRGTGCDARLSIPVMGGSATGLRVDIAAAAPGGSDLTIVVDGTTIERLRVPADGWHGTVDLPPTGETVDVRLVSETFIPSDEIPGSADDRRLGVRVQGIALLGEPEG